MLRAHLDAEEWGAAAQLARAHGLDPDEVHKARWLASPPGKEALNDALAKVVDRAWAAAQCAASVASTYEQQRFVLVYGLKESERRCGRNGGDDTGNFAWNWWTRLRLTLLAQLDRLDTLHAVHLGNTTRRGPGRRFAPSPSVTRRLGSRRRVTRGRRRPFCDVIPAPGLHPCWTLWRRFRRPCHRRSTRV